MTADPGLLVARSTWPEVEAALAAGAIAVLPIGAAAKEHGLHLPMATDWLQAEWLGRELARRVRVVVWPTVGYGHYPAFLEYPGSTSLSAPTFVAVVAEILDDLFRAGAARAVVCNTGISTIRPLERAREESPRRPAIGLVHVYRGPRFLEATRRLARQARGGHADEVETSVMLVVAPEAVDLDRAEPWDEREVVGPLSRRDPASPGWSPSGACGDPTLATREKGEAFVAAMLEDLLEAIREEPDPAIG